MTESQKEGQHLKRTEMNREISSAGQIVRASLLALVAAATLVGIPMGAGAQATGVPSAAPPMGWNSWDSYGATVNEGQVKANADWMATNLKDFGWQFVVVDMEWFVSNPGPERNATDSIYSLDATGRY